MIIPKKHCSMRPVYQRKLNLENSAIQTTTKAVHLQSHSASQRLRQHPNKDIEPTATATAAAAVTETQKLVALITAGIAKAKRANGPWKRTVGAPPS